MIPRIDVRSSTCNIETSEIVLHLRADEDNTRPERLRHRKSCFIFGPTKIHSTKAVTDDVMEVSDSAYLTHFSSRLVRRLSSVPPTLLHKGIFIRSFRSFTSRPELKQAYNFPCEDVARGTPRPWNCVVITHIASQYRFGAELIGGKPYRLER